jgi:hypothetical protein
MSQFNNDRSKLGENVIRVPSRAIRTTDNNNNSDLRDGRDDIEIIDLDTERLRVAQHTWG